MTKAELIEGLANKLNLNKADAEKAVNLLLDDIVAALKQGDRVNISGFGTFSVSERASRVGRNPKTGEKVEVPAKRIPFFKPSKELKDFVNSDEAAAMTSAAETAAASSGNSTHS